MTDEKGASEIMQYQFRYQYKEYQLISIEPAIEIRFVVPFLEKARRAARKLMGFKGMKFLIKEYHFVVLFLRFINLFPRFHFVNKMYLVILDSCVVQH